MKRLAAVALVVALPLLACGPALASPGSAGSLTIDKGAGVWPAKRLNGDGTKKMGPVTFDHGRHGDEYGCVRCHHQELALKPGDTEAKSCFECHGRETRGAQLDSFEIIHGKQGSCLACHKTDTRAQAAQAPRACADCHAGAK